MRLVRSQVIPGASGLAIFARVLGKGGVPVNSATFATVSITVTDQTAEAQVPGSGLAGYHTPDPTQVLYDTLQTGDSRWTADSADQPGPDGLTGYNLYFVVPAADLATSGHTFRVDLRLTPRLGEPVELSVDVSTLKVLGALHVAWSGVLIALGSGQTQDTSSGGYGNDTTTTTGGGSPLPPAPTLVSFTANGTSELDGTFTLGDSQATAVNLYVSADGLNWTTTTLSASARSFALTGLAASTTRSVYVTEVAAGGESNPSNVLTATTDAIGGGSVLGAPTITQTAAASDTVGALRWTEVPGATYYELRCAISGSGNWSTAAMRFPAWTEGLFGGASNPIFAPVAGQAVDLQLRAGNDTGPGNWSATATVTMLAAAHIASPTGRNPRVFWSPLWQADMANAGQVYAGNPGGGIHPKYLDLAAWGAAPNSSPEQGDSFTAAAILYQVTGNATYAANAWAALKANLTGFNPLPGSANAMRNTYALGVVCFAYEWLYPWLSANGHVAECVQMINDLCEYNIGGGPDVTSGAVQAFGLLLAQDVTWPAYFLFQLTDLLTVGDNPSAGTYGNATIQKGDKLPVGGLTATAADYTTVRNALAFQMRSVANADGIDAPSSMGIHGQSFDYDQNTMAKAVEGARAVRDVIQWQTLAAGGTQHTENVPEFLDYATHQLPNLLTWENTPDLASWFQNGDAETFHGTPGSQARRLASILLAAIYSSPGSVGASYLQQLLTDLATLYGWGGAGGGMQSHPHSFALWAPYVTATNYRAATNQKRGHVARGIPTLLYQETWGDGDVANANGSAFQAYMRSHIAVQHNDISCGDVQAYGGGAAGGWAITHPIGYQAGFSGAHRTKNLPVCAGLGAMNDNSPGNPGRGAFAVEYDSGPFKNAYICGGYSGTRYQSIPGPGNWGINDLTGPRGLIPPSFVNECMRSALFLPATDQSSCVLILFDRLRLLNVRLQSVLWKGLTYQGAAMYSASTSEGPSDQASIAAAVALAVDQFWVPSAFVQVGRRFTYPVGSGWHAQLDLLRPVDMQLRLMAGSVVLPAAGFTAAEQAYERIEAYPAIAWPADLTEQYTPFLSAWAFGANSVNFTHSPLLSADGTTAVGVLAQRTGQNDVIAMFGALQAGRVLESGYTVSWVQGSATANLFLADLDPAKTWKLAVDGGSPVTLTTNDCSTGPNFPCTARPPATANAKVQVVGAGAHTGVLTAT